MNSSCSCDAELNHQYTNNHHSWNQNDRIGLMMILLVLSIFVLSMYLIMTWRNRTSYYVLLSVLVFLIVMFVGISVSSPIFLLYAPSFVLALFIRTPPILNRHTYFPNHTYFENPDTFAKIQGEVDAMLQHTNQGNSLSLTQDSYGGANKYIGSDVQSTEGVQRAWRLLNIMVGTSFTQDALDHFPTLVSVLRQLPEVKSCVVSVLEPGIRIPIHVGYYKGIMRYMIPTHIPQDRENVFLCVNGIKYHWTEGEGVLWDDTYVHKVYNNSTENRVLIYMDVIRPLHNEPISWLNGFNKWFVNTVTGSSIIQDEIKRTEKQISIADL